PFLILVLAYGDSFGFRRAHLTARPATPARPGLPVSGFDALLDLGGMGEWWRPAFLGRAGGPNGIRGGGLRGGVRCARVGSGAL
ncbi:hypothetical protein ACOTGJ_08215, partial [Achromobacter xylosoxidans]